ncbi:DNA polymerase epsilon subunit 4 [Hyposmocoma kahamanoa]|uniref:DNA polymerase epsilon subunit 4 n=1 Tax=Hyposmocoma kahamanoa TaxID=1477025 RepID=UPI000E6D9559|nr:DNA polymerase epsilon subunit 4 [Hyposmocoma kahamanoa]
MAEENHYSDINISDVVEDTEHYIDSEQANTEIMEFDTETHTEMDSEVINSEEQNVGEKKPHNQTPKSETVKSTRLPIARIRNIMKMDPDVNIVHQDAVFLVTKATEMFLETMAKEIFSYLPKNKKTINKKELDLVINKVDCLCFLEGAMDF